MSSERATPEEHTREIARMRTLIEHIQQQAALLQEAAQHLPEEEAEPLGEKAEMLVQQADEIKEAVEALESRTN